MTFIKIETQSLQYTLTHIIILFPDNGMDKFVVWIKWIKFVDLRSSRGTGSPDVFWVDENIVVSVVHIIPSSLASQYTGVLPDFLNDLRPWAPLLLVFLVSSTPWCFSHSAEDSPSYTSSLKEDFHYRKSLNNLTWSCEWTNKR